MKTNIIKIVRNVSVAFGLFAFTGCVDLEPDPLSMYEPGLTFTTKAGLDAAMVTCDQTFRLFYYGERAHFMLEWICSDVGVSGETDKTTVEQDFNLLFSPTNTFSGWYYWQEGFWGIKYANTILSYIDGIEELTEEEKNEYKALSYFHRAWRYYHLLFQFGDIPYMDGITTTPKSDYRSVKMDVIIDKMIADLEFAVKHAPIQSDYGKANRGSARMLLMKYYLAHGDFDKAIEQGNELIDKSGYALMTNTFGVFDYNHTDVRPITRNVIWDLHRPVNKSHPENKETIQTTVSRYEADPDARLFLTTLRNHTSFWTSAAIVTPGNKTVGMSRDSKENFVNFFNGKLGDEAKAKEEAQKYYLMSTYGRGIAFTRPTYYSEKMIWTDPTDLRSSNETGNWFKMEDLVYNNAQGLIGTPDEKYLGKHIQKYSDSGELLCSDTIRCWFDWPYYKLWVYEKDLEDQNQYNGGPGDWYIYRLAETYLLRAEAYFWKGDLVNAAKDLNKVRERAQCTNMFTASDVNMGTIFDERARELSYEEFRHVELVRASYIFAKQGKSDEFGNSYSDATPKGLAENSYWWTRICKYNNYYNKGVKTAKNVPYTISKHHLFWPVPQNEINRNSGAVLNQNFGYAGYEKNIAPIDNLEEAITSNK